MIQIHLKFTNWLSLHMHFKRSFDSKASLVKLRNFEKWGRCCFGHVGKQIWGLLSNLKFHLRFILLPLCVTDCIAVQTEYFLSFRKAKKISNFINSVQREPVCFKLEKNKHYFEFWIAFDVESFQEYFLNSVKKISSIRSQCAYIQYFIYKKKSK